MSLSFPSMNNLGTVPITIANSNTLVAPTSPSTITMTAISSASGMVSTNRAADISVVYRG